MTQGLLTAAQHDYLLSAKIRASRISKLQGNSYLEAWDVRAQLIRVFGFGNFDLETIKSEYLGEHRYEGKDKKEMVEVRWLVTMRLTIRDPEGYHLATYSESAVGSQSGGYAGAGLGDLNDNAIKSASSGALKRCCINLGTQFGLSLYDNGTLLDVVKITLVRPEGATKGDPAQPSGDPVTDAAAQTLRDSLGAEIVSEEPGMAQSEQVSDQPGPDGGPEFTRKADTPEQAAQAVKEIGS